MIRKEKLLTVHHKHSKSHGFTQRTLGYHFILASIIKRAPKDIECYAWVKVGKDGAEISVVLQNCALIALFLAVT